MNFNYDSIAQITDVLKNKSLGLKKRWGQNFLVNRGAREKLVNLLDLQAGEKVWEIGPGMGAMTQLILSHPVCLTAFEIDRGLLSFLEESYTEYRDFKLVQGDVLKTWPSVAAENGAPAKVLGNLPYSSASAIIASFVEQKLRPDKLVFTVQKELALRMTANPGQKNYSSFSIFCQYAFKIRQEGDLQPGSFYPVPEVYSTIISLVPVNRATQPTDEQLFFRLVRCAFHSRRKTLRNNLFSSELATIYGKSGIEKALRESGLTDNIRGERLTIDDFFRITERLNPI